MDTVFAVIAGAAAGLLAVAPFLIAFRRQDMAGGLAAVISSFFIITLLIVMVRKLHPVSLVPAGTASVLTFLIAMVLMFARYGWRD